ncbi:MAG: hypothetical protein IPJ55_07515 [Chloracidobacterium sp.]|nr:hypothetical protein [Chloracidobacterium sp.]
MLGPAPASISRLKNEFRLQIILKGASRKTLRLSRSLSQIPRITGGDMRSIYVEIDPVNLCEESRGWLTRYPVRHGIVIELRIFCYSDGVG